jgi:hypothetical protein
LLAAATRRLWVPAGQPVTVVKVQLGLRTDNQERLQKDLIKLKDVLAVSDLPPRLRVDLPCQLCTRAGSCAS